MLMMPTTRWHTGLTLSVRLPVIASICALVSAFTDEPQSYSTTPIPSQPHYQLTTDPSLPVWPWRSYRTSSHTPPQLNINRSSGRLATGYIFLSPSDSHKHDGTYDMSGTGFIMDQNGDLIFAADEDGMGFCEEWVAGMTDFRVQRYEGREYVTYWNGCNTRGLHWGHRWGRVTFIDDGYEVFILNPDLKINTLEPATRGNVDVHDHQMTDRNSMVVTSYNNTQHDLTSLGGSPDAWVADGMIFDIDVKTQKVLFKWRALDHLALNASHYKISAAGAGSSERVPYDWLHINSVQRVGEDYLISSRHHFAVYMISGKDGSVLWKLDGTDGGSFGSIPVNFRWQHHARAHNVTKDGMTVSLFNNMYNGGVRNEKTQTSGLAFWLPLPPDKNKPPVLVRQLQTPGDPLYSGTQGSYQMDIGHGNGFVGYGTVPIIREYDSAGTMLWQAQFGEKTAVQNYRAFKMEWHGTPKSWDPIALIENPRHHTPRVYVSWNGATDISSWAVFTGASRDLLNATGVAAKKGFETVFEVEKSVACVQVGAIRGREIIRKSNVACLGDQEVAWNATDISRLAAENARLKSELLELRRPSWSVTKTIGEIVAVAFGVILVAVGLVYVFPKRQAKEGRYKPVQSEEW